MVERIANLCEKARLDALRLECLKLAMQSEQPLSGEGVTEVAEHLFDFVTNAPKRPTLFVVKRIFEAKDSDEEKCTFLSISGSIQLWSWESLAYRFRSFEEACEAVVRFAGMADGEMKIEQLPDHFEPF